ncbi:hypothetical protein [Marinigracilibium pacificum]|uniref:Lipocalin-like protein n=1 Tax=Marinigracilibium pacificum TaxID=2729599 RepID=A0A848IWE5_9BACT|nr:hypothetical protein [Marinigracilibium pacificum]NMM47488.1 hypothetical protein [Marinigracilibium pacificum]
MNLFKSLSLFFVVLLVFSSCSEEENAPAIQEEEIEGNWTLSDMDYDSDAYMIFEGQTTKTADITGKITESNMVVSFSSEPNTATATGNYKMDLTIKPFIGESTTQNLTMESIDGFGSEWRIEGNKFYMKDPEGVESALEILKLTNSEFILKGEYNYEEADELFEELVIKTDVFFTIYFTK